MSMQRSLMVTQQPFKPSYYRPICQLAIPENYDWRQFPRESPSKLSEKSRMPLQVALRHTERVLFGPFWRSYTGQIYGRNPAPTPFRTVSLGNSANKQSRKPGAASDRTQERGARATERMLPFESLM